MFAHINTHLPPDAKILMIYMKNFGYLCDRPFYADSIFESHTIEKILAASRTPRDVYRALKKRGFTHILYDIRYVFGERSTLSADNQSLMSDFQKQHLEAIRVEKSLFYLFRVM
jgi:hypothetical protein